MERIYRVWQNDDTFYAVERDGELRRASGDPFTALSAGAPVSGGLAGVSVLAPVRPSKIVCVGLNYSDHAAEQGKSLPAEPLLFIKPSSAVVGPGEPIRRPPGVGRVDHEAELGIVIGRRAHRVSAANAWDYVLGLICVNDVTARDLQRKDVQFTRAKSFDTFCPVGPFIVDGLDPLNLSVTTRVNGALKQNGRTADMAFSVPFLIRYISNIMTLYPGELIATGTPAGVSPMQDGDMVEVEIEGIGVLENPVRDAA